jgi:hypothetical protein
VSQIEVRVRRTVITLVTCEGCTLEQAKADPFEYSVDEMEVDQVDYVVLSAKEVE